MIRLQKQYITDGENQAVSIYKLNEHFGTRKGVMILPKANLVPFYNIVKNIERLDCKGNRSSFLCNGGIMIYENNPLYTRALEMASK